MFHVKHWELEMEQQNKQTPFLKRVNNIEKSVKELEKIVNEIKNKLDTILKSLRGR